MTDEHDEWRTLNDGGSDRQRRLREIATEPGITARQAYYRALSEGLVEKTQEGFEEISDLMKGTAP
jgi:hypothetical protein